MQQELSEFLDRLAGIANSVKAKLAWLVGIGLIASTIIAWRVYSPESVVWWNVVKCSLVMLPSLIWLFVWSILGQLSEAPALAADLTANEDVALGKLDFKSNLNEKSGISSLISTLRTFRQQEGFEVLFDTIGSVTLLANPLFLIIAFIMVVLLIMLIFIAPWLLLV